MSLENRIQHLKKFALEKVEGAAKKSDTQNVILNSRMVEEIERLSNILADIHVKVDSLEKKIKNPPDSASDNLLSQDSEQFIPRLDSLARSSSLSKYIKESPRVRGETKRREFVDSVKEAGINLIHQRGALYVTDHDGLVGIAYASERQPNRWFLGLPDNDYAALVLICETDRSDLLNFILPSDFFHKYRDSFSFVKGQIKFNIVCRGNDYTMIIPNSGNIRINQFLNNYNALKHKHNL